MLVATGMSLSPDFQLIEKGNMYILIPMYTLLQMFLYLTNMLSISETGCPSPTLGLWQLALGGMAVENSWQ